jgi:acyl-CoA reductase-like NAD-dependent aldehyde dehydrogenase
MNAAMKLREFASYSVQPSPATPPASSQSAMDTAIKRLREGATRFARLSIDQRLRLAQNMQQGYLRVAERSVRAGCQAKGIAQGTPVEAEEWATGPWGVMRQLRLIRESLVALQRSGNTPIGSVGRAADGRLSVRVYPGNTIDGLLFKDWTIDVRMQAGVTEQKLESSRARFYKERRHDGRVVLVLGAGNIAAIPAMDALTFLFNEGKVCLIKMNPVNAYVGPYIEEAFAEAIRENFIAVVYGGAEEGRYLVYHREIDEVHITGSDKTHDAIVWGPPGLEREARIQRNDPLLKKPISSELGNITPLIIVPGPYSEKELRFQAEDAASYFVMNASFMCNAAKMLVLPEGWKGSETYLQGMQDICAAVPPRRAYYPGAEDRWLTLTTGRRNVKRIGDAGAGTLPWTFISGLDPDSRDDLLYTQEPFCSVICDTRLGSSDAVEFLDKAVDFANNRLWGTLTASLVVHPKSLKDPRVRDAVDRAITCLRYGTVTVNCFSGVSFVSASPPWGAYPGASLDNIQSGSGFVHNTAMLEGVEKVVMRAPLTGFPKPGYFPTHRTAHKIAPRIVALEENASWSKVPAVVFNAMRG